MACIAGGNQAIDLLLQFAKAEVVAVFDDDFEAACLAQAGNRRRSKEGRLSIGNLVGEDLAHVLGDGRAGQRWIATFGELVEGNEKLAKIGAVGVERKRLTCDAGRVDGALHFVGITHDLADLIDYVLRALHGG